jgi:hypothetical protein
MSATMDIEDDDDFYAPEEPKVPVDDKDKDKAKSDDLEEGEEEDEGAAMDEDDDSDSDSVCAIAARLLSRVYTNEPRISTSSQNERTAPQLLLQRTCAQPKLPGPALTHVQTIKIQRYSKHTTEDDVERWRSYSICQEGRVQKSQLSAYWRAERR